MVKVAQPISYPSQLNPCIEIHLTKQDISFRLEVTFVTYNAVSLVDVMGYFDEG